MKASSQALSKLLTTCKMKRTLLRLIPMKDCPYKIKWILISGLKGMRWVQRSFQHLLSLFPNKFINRIGGIKTNYAHLIC
jgi:hypothetical protein